MASAKMSLKLLVDRKESRVLFAEAPKEFVDFLFHIFSLPLGTLIEFLGSDQMVGSLGKLKASIENFHLNYLQQGIKIKDIFHPKTPFTGETFMLSYDHASLKHQSAGASKAAVYGCINALSWCHECSGHEISCGRTTCPEINRRCQSVATLYSKSRCPGCNSSMNHAKELVVPKEVEETVEIVKKKKGGGYVKEVVTYMVMDDLEVKPLSAISSITLINKFGVKDLSQLEEKTVSFGKYEGLKLLMASLKTDKVLTTIFMN